jgi:chromate transport protein ChrA
MTIESEHEQFEELLDEESIAVLAILLAVALEFGFGFAKTVSWWAGLVAGPTALIVLIVLFRLPRSHAWLVRAAAWVVRSRDVTGPRRRPAASAGERIPSQR